jgi:hypothetical protein
MRQIEELLSREFWRQFLRIIQAAESPMLEKTTKKRRRRQDQRAARPRQVARPETGVAPPWDVAFN